MINSPWQSTVLRQHKLANILSELVYAATDGNLMQESKDVLFVTPKASSVPVFISPLTTHEYGQDRMRTTAAILDGRSFMRLDRHAEVGYVITNQLQADFFARVGLLTSYWVNEPEYRQDFLRVGEVPAQTYIAWVSQAITTKLGINVELAREIQILVALFYIHQFVSSDEANDKKEQAKYTTMIMRWTRAPAEMVSGIVDVCSYMPHMEDFVKELQSQFQHNTRISQINVGFLVMTLGRSWFGYGANEIAAVSIEYPPMYLALIEAACNSKVWKKTQLGRLTERFTVGRAGDAFLRSMDMLVARVEGNTRTGKRVSFEMAGTTETLE